MAMARRATVRRDTLTTTMAMGNDNNPVDGDSAPGSEVDDDGNGMAGDDNDNDDGDDDNDGDGDGAMGSGATGYNDDDNVDG